MTEGGKSRSHCRQRAAAPTARQQLAQRGPRVVNASHERARVRDGPTPSPPQPCRDALPSVSTSPRRPSTRGGRGASGGEGRIIIIVVRAGRTPTPGRRPLAGGPDVAPHRELATRCACACACACGRCRRRWMLLRGSMDGRTDGRMDDIDDAIADDGRNRCGGSASRRGRRAAAARGGAGAPVGARFRASSALRAPKRAQNGALGGPPRRGGGSSARGPRNVYSLCILSPPWQGRYSGCIRRSGDGFRPGDGHRKPPLSGTPASCGVSNFDTCAPMCRGVCGRAPCDTASGAAGVRSAHTSGAHGGVDDDPRQQAVVDRKAATDLVARRAVRATAVLHVRHTLQPIPPQAAGPAGGGVMLSARYIVRDCLRDGTARLRRPGASCSLGEAAAALGQPGRPACGGMSCLPI
eukprot:scaffold230_cov353-Prasinococcus_capsulatus_cf.AAC.10